ncbi:E3 ubiquitin-protein ligase UPL6-like isoform X5 [Gossypium arboreum]|uniref:E3 ubiquitin-protein ligase UPL6-like isoform X5 n=2 Tax=Gossypium arboreum TaxID=29729 RepID=UPI000818F4EC|nr:E3 ubiquitin-protein ligase UPL6-like isoform X5 [Gossypium arboreum]
MFFTGDPTTRKRVDLGSQSSKERDRQKLLKQTRLERNRCLWLCQQNSAALKIQKYFRRGKVVEVERAKVREQFYKTYGKHGHHVDRHCFGPDLEFLRQLIFFVNAWNMNDFSVLAEICRLIQHFVPRKWLKRLSFACIQAIYHNRALIYKECQSNDELHEARKVLI